MLGRMKVFSLSIFILLLSILGGHVQRAKSIALRVKRHGNVGAYATKRSSDSKTHQNARFKALAGEDETGEEQATGAATGTEKEEEGPTGSEATGSATGATGSEATGAENQATGSATGATGGEATGSEGETGATGTATGAEEAIEQKRPVDVRALLNSVMSDTIDWKDRLIARLQAYIRNEIPSAVAFKDEEDGPTGATGLEGETGSATGTSEASTGGETGSVTGSTGSESAGTGATGSEDGPTGATGSEEESDRSTGATGSETGSTGATGSTDATGSTGATGSATGSETGASEESPTGSQATGSATGKESSAEDAGDAEEKKGPE